MLTRAEIAHVNRQHRQNDDSELWPINGRFNVTERAIRLARYWRLDVGVILDTPEDYSALLERIESEIVNNEHNW